MTNNSQNTDLLLNSVPNPIKEPLIHAGEDVNTSVQGKSPSKFLIFFQKTQKNQKNSNFKACGRKFSVANAIK